MLNLLIVDDEEDIVNALKIYLQDPDWNLIAAENGAQAVEIAEQVELHLILMDIMMPVMDGITAMMKIREKSNVPIIFLTARSQDADKILGLTIGADDYITKPFNPLEVGARVRSQLRRYMKFGSGPKQEELLQVGGIELNDQSKQVLVDGNEVSLTPKEYEILKFLMSNVNHVFSPKEIYTAVWKERCYGVENTVAVHIRHLREKVEIDPANPRYIKVIFGQGYKFEGGRI